MVPKLEALYNSIFSCSDNKETDETNKKDEENEENYLI